MHTTHLKWYSPILGGETEMEVFGTEGYPVIAFPTSMGRYFQNKDFKLIEAARPLIEAGKVKIYCVDGVDTESWYNKKIHPSERVKKHQWYDKFLCEEIIPLAQKETGFAKVCMAGCSFGGYHAANMAFRYPSVVGFLLAMGAGFDIKGQMDGYYDDDVYYNNPPDFLPNMSHPELWKMGIVLGAGSEDFCLPQNQKMSEILHKKGVAHWLDIRPGAVHDWPVWREMFPDYLAEMLRQNGLL